LLPKDYGTTYPHVRSQNKKRRPPKKRGKKKPTWEDPTDGPHDVQEKGKGKPWWAQSQGKTQNQRVFENGRDTPEEETVRGQPLKKGVPHCKGKRNG